jgi:hypothetical protein
MRARERLAILKADRAATKGFSAGAAGVACDSVRPNGCKPFSCGRSRINSKIRGAITTAMVPIVMTAMRHPEATTICASSGRKTSCPVAELAVRRPNASPRFR